MQTETSEIYQKYQPGSFHHIYWKLQMDASSQQDARGICWHPSMIRVWWCLFLMHKSGGAYEALHKSGVLKLPSQRTLMDYTCDEWEKCVLILLDEMHIHEDLAYDKHTDKLVAFTNLGDIANHLLALKNPWSIAVLSGCLLACTVTVLMVRGLFTSFSLPTHSFHVPVLPGKLLYTLFWDAVHGENRGLWIGG